MGISKNVAVQMTEKTNNEKKKEYLREYRDHVRRIKRIESELTELRAMRLSVSGRNDGMPRGSGQSDLSGYAAELDQLETSLCEEMRQRCVAYKDIANQINSVVSENEKDVLFYRYINGLDWWEIAEKMNYSERWVLKLHGKALAHFQLPQKKSS